MIGGSLSTVHELVCDSDNYMENLLFLLVTITHKMITEPNFSIFELLLVISVL